MAVLMFGGDLTISKTRDKLVVGGWIGMKMSEVHAVLFCQLQREVDMVLRAKVEDPHKDVTAQQMGLRRVLGSLLASPALR